MSSNVVCICDSRSCFSDECASCACWFLNDRLYLSTDFDGTYKCSLSSPNERSVTVVVIGEELVTSHGSVDRYSVFSREFEEFMDD